jgi:hypothetical protein
MTVSEATQWGTTLSCHLERYLTWDYIGTAPPSIHTEKEVMKMCSPATSTPFLSAFRPLCGRFLWEEPCPTLTLK